MVDPIGIKAGTVVDRRPTPIVSPEPVAQTASVKAVQPQAQETVAATQIARSLAAEAPVDAERVSRIKKAVQEGRFPLVPSTIADRLLALKLEWNPNEPA
jgi:negative regulator of flagellin synthesis FlgM